MTDTPQVYAAMSAVQGELSNQGIAKGQYNSFDKYNFRGIDDVLNAVGPALHRAGLLILPDVIDTLVEEKPTQKGGVQLSVQLKIRYDFISVADGSKLSITTIGHAMDRGDKAVPKAQTAAYKYMILNAFSVPTESTPDADTESPEMGAPDKLPAINTERAEVLKTLIDESKTNSDQFLAHFKAPSISDFPAVKYQQACQMLRQKLANAAEKVA